MTNLLLPAKKEERLTVDRVDDRVYGDVLHDGEVLELPVLLLLQEDLLLVRQPLGAVSPVSLAGAGEEAPKHVGHQADNLRVVESRVKDI